MSDNAPVEFGGYSKEQVALLLMERIAYAENLALSGSSINRAKRDWILRTYAECLLVVRNPEIKQPMPAALVTPPPAPQE
jgi:hypothetical protein